MMERIMDYSFIIPVYNCKDYISDCVESIRAVRARSYEILLIDDGSNDGSEMLCDDLAKKYSEVRVIHQSNVGASAARNSGIKNAQGEMVMFIDADDSIDSTELYNILSDPKCTNADLVIYGLTFDYYSHKKCYRRDPLFFDFDGIMTKRTWGEVFEKLYEHNSLSPMWNKIFKRKVLIENKLELNTDMFLYEDFEFVLRYLQYCDNIWNVPKAVYHYRQAEDEGNAKRRLMRIDSIPDFLIPIETALTQLLTSNAYISTQQKERILQQLYLVLAREKISVSNLVGVQNVCRDFIQWAEGRNLPIEASQFQKKLLNKKAFSLILADKKTTVRHKIAVWVKSRLHRI